MRKIVQQSKGPTLVQANKVVNATQNTPTKSPSSTHPIQNLSNLD